MGLTKSSGRTVLLSVLLMATTASAQIGMGFSIWDLVSEGRCAETITFMGEQEYLLESGEQLLTKAYKFKQYRKTDFYTFLQRTTSNNGLPNCAGLQGARKGTRIKSYVKFNQDSTEMSLYLQPDDAAAIDAVFQKREQVK